MSKLSNAWATAGQRLGNGWATAGQRALHSLTSTTKTTAPETTKPPQRKALGVLKFGAGNEARTRDLNLGKVALYQLSYTRMRLAASVWWRILKTPPAAVNTAHALFFLRQLYSELFDHARQIIHALCERFDVFLVGDAQARQGAA